MLSKIINIKTTVPLAALGVLSFAGSASAAAFTDGDQLNVTFSGFQINNAMPSAIDGNPGDDVAGAANGAADAIFAVLDGDTTNEPGNIILDNPEGEFQDAEPGDIGNFRVGDGSSGAFDTLTEGQVGEIRTFDAVTLNLVNELTDSNFFARVGDFTFSLEEITFFGFNPFGSTNFGQPVPNGFLIFQGTGRALNADTGQNVPATFQLSAQGINDNGLGGDIFANNGVTNVTTQSGSAVVTVGGVQVPEPNGMIATAVALGLGFLGSKKRWLRN